MLVPTLPERLATIVGEPLTLEELKFKPGRRRTMRASGPLGTVIVKCYMSARAPAVGARVSTLAGGPPEPAIPRVLLVDANDGYVVLSDLEGEPLRVAVLGRDWTTCARAGTALGSWHRYWTGARSEVFPLHTPARELAILEQRLERAPSDIVDAVAAEWDRVASLAWECTTVVHRDLYEEQLLVGDRTGLIDLDDAALGPPELDLGNLFAHLRLLGRRTDHDVEPAIEAFREGYGRAGPHVDPELVARCVVVSALRLACIHGDAALAGSL